MLTRPRRRAGHLRERAETAARSPAERTRPPPGEPRSTPPRRPPGCGGLAQAEARRLIEEARARAEELVSEHAVVRAAEERGAALIRDAEARAERLAADAEGYMRDADHYVAGVMTELEEHLGRVTATVRKGLGALHGANRRDRGRGKPAGRRPVLIRSSGRVYSASSARHFPVRALPLAEPSCPSPNNESRSAGVTPGVRITPWSCPPSIPARSASSHGGPTGCVPTVATTTAAR